MQRVAAPRNTNERHDITEDQRPSSRPEVPSSQPIRLMSVTTTIPSHSLRYAICSFATSSLDMLHPVSDHTSDLWISRGHDKPNYQITAIRRTLTADSP